MARGFKTGGRQKGSLNTRTALARENARQVLDSAKAALGDKMADLDAHTLLKLVYRNTDLDLAVRLDAAKAALRHEVPVMAQSSIDLTVGRRLEECSDAELYEIIARHRQLPAPTDEPIQVEEGYTEIPLEIGEKKPA
jgi:hypothetical protein